MPPQDSITIETCVEGAWVWYSGESVSFGVTNPGLPLIRLLSLGKLHIIFEPLFPQVWKGGKTSLWHFLVRSENITQVAGRYYYPYCHHYYHNHKYMDDCNTELINGDHYYCTRDQITGVLGNTRFGSSVWETTNYLGPFRVRW